MLRTLRFSTVLLAAACLITAWLAMPAPCAAQFKAGDTKGSQIDKTTTQRWRMGLVVSAVGGPCSGIVGTLPVPTDWPEQKVRIIAEDVSDHVAKVDYRLIGGGVKQMVVDIPKLSKGAQAKAIITFEVTRSSLAPPADTAMFTVPKKVERDISPLLAPSPFIESRHPKIVKLAKELIAEQESAWDKVEAIYDGVRERVTFKEGPIKGALKALADGEGDCEEMVSLFVAMCRANNIPARMVWVPHHCYAEFYLIDDDGRGHWIPCNLPTNVKSFGGLPEMRPILQKGDSFRDPNQGNKPVRYITEFMKGNVGGNDPHVTFIRDEAP